MTIEPRPYEIRVIESQYLIVPRETYQRKLTAQKSKKIAENFDERIANEPKVSFRDGRYYVFDGQHTIIGRILRNGGKHLPIRCKVFYGLTEEDEANLFAQQTGISTQLSPGAKIRASVFGKNPEDIALVKATESVGLTFDFNRSKGTSRLACAGTARNLFQKYGEELYTEALSIIVEAWDGAPDSLRAETLKGVTRFIDLYAGEYDRRRLVACLRRVDPITIYREGRSMSCTMSGDKRYLYQVYSLYNGSSRKYSLPLKF